MGRELAGVGDVIGCVSGDLGSVWNRVLRWNDWRGGRGGAPRLLVGLGGVGSGEVVGSEVLRLLEIHFWISDAGDNGSDCGTSKLDSDLLRVWVAAVLDRISPLIPSTALCLLFLYVTKSLNTT